MSTMPPCRSVRNHPVASANGDQYLFRTWIISTLFGGLAPGARFHPSRSILNYGECVSQHPFLGTEIQDTLWGCAFLTANRYWMLTLVLRTVGSDPISHTVACKSSLIVVTNMQSADSLHTGYLFLHNML